MLSLEKVIIATGGGTLCGEGTENQSKLKKLVSTKTSLILHTDKKIINVHSLRETSILMVLLMVPRKKNENQMMTIPRKKNQNQMN